MVASAADTLGTQVAGEPYVLGTELEELELAVDVSFVALYTGLAVGNVEC